MFPVIDKKKTAERISAIMKVYGKTPADIQNYLKLSCVQTVYRWLEGVNIPSIDNLYALSQLFQIPMDTMIAGNRQEYTLTLGKGPSSVLSEASSRGYPERYALPLGGVRIPALMYISGSETSGYLRGYYDYFAKVRTHGYFKWRKGVSAGQGRQQEECDIPRYRRCSSAVQKPETLRL